jgi:hypothetical protein
MNFNKYYYYYIPAHYGGSGGAVSIMPPLPLLRLDTGNINEESKIVNKSGGWLKKLRCRIFQTSLVIN